MVAAQLRFVGEALGARTNYGCFSLYQVRTGRETRHLSPECTCYGPALALIATKPTY